VDQKPSGVRKQSSSSLGGWHFESVFTLTKSLHTISSQIVLTAL
jgi:hypothetical protein